ncbi:hypothetical protein [Nonomuraea turkmeniaca]|nr:hypothetical protein [Nonomuraea turkmeniaca]
MEIGARMCADPEAFRAELLGFLAAFAAAVERLGPGLLSVLHR